MALFNRTKREINAKIVYFGSPLAGKATTLQFIHRKLKPECRGPMKTMGGQSDRMLFFDFMPPELGEVNDYRVRFHLYTVQGEVTNRSTWKTVLKGADGIVFVADASPESAAITRESMENLRECLRSYGQDLEKLPCVVQCNKSDLPDALSTEELAQLVDSAGFPVIRSASRTGEGILQVLSSVVKGVMNALRDQEGSVTADSSVGLAGMGSEDEQAPVERGEKMATVPTDLAERVDTLPGAAVPTLAMGGAVTVAADGTLQVPLTVGCGGAERGFVLTLELTPAASVVA
ncbi:GTP-binding domain-containing protein [Geobacter metallireducens RCH3]|uniref:GTP-binding domain protein n=1 Tax=Geobacter metallireducens (strain ATCC 53774 / DSM 7210 / GS-15) TaxID=269799 RepID=Q39U63_GEOMG|nr:ADP-ribosylation factor-like protein [Geobacter metallireducens]ABB32211.1 GTP-binding domain protein [Geobacter metallireducens GS-15]EHP87022.1 GTP-binding domain-containing protein [Geobacter metallireducens RCH3]